MAFFGKTFAFDGTPCEDYDLMLYDISRQDEDIVIAGVSKIEDESVGHRWRPYFYGTKPGDKLEFDITFGVNEHRIDEGKFLDNWELSGVTAWLCGHSDYKWLYVEQFDTGFFWYKCMITDMRVTRYGSVPWALTAHVTCDSPYAYMDVQNYTYTVNGSRTIDIYNESSMNDWYYPTVTFTRTSGTAFSVKNAADNNRGPEFTGIPGAVTEISIDNEHCVVTNDQDVNLYSGFNFQFLRLARGYNRITITGRGTITISCEYPVNVGG